MGNHAPLSREDESKPSRPGPDRERRRYRDALVPIEIETRPNSLVGVLRYKVRPPPTSRCVWITPIMRTQYRYVLLYALSACMHTPYDAPSLAVPGVPRPPYPLSLHVAHQNILFLSHRPPLPTDQQKLAPDPLDIISVTSSSDSPLPPPRHSARNSKTQTTQVMAHVLVPSLPPKSDYGPFGATALHARSPGVK